MEKFTIEDIQKLYASEAAKHSVAGTSTIQDMRTRQMEITAVSSYIRDKQRVLEVGCGNGYTACRLVEQFDIDLEAFDFSPDLIKLALQQDLSGARGRVTFAVGDVLAYNKQNAFDLVFSMRCLQNLLSWDDQKEGLRNVVAALKVGGEYIMEECFWTGLNNLNEARAELDLDPIPESWHNNFFDEEETIAFMQSIGCRYLDQSPFLSGYYFGSRVLLPALAPKGQKITSASRLNDYFAHLPPAGDFSPMKILRFTRER